MATTLQGLVHPALPAPGADTAPRAACPADAGRATTVTPVAAARHVLAWLEAAWADARDAADPDAGLLDEAAGWVREYVARAEVR